MTAELAILNKSAVALAADSAVTITNRKGEKIYNSANKLFALSKYHSVGIMVYGNADLSGVPWETIIKVYRKSLGDRCSDTIQDYANDFFNFLQEKDNYLFNEKIIDSGMDRTIFNFLVSVKKEFKYTLQASFENEHENEHNSEIDPVEIIKFTERFLLDKKDEISSYDFLDNFNTDDVAGIMVAKEEKINEMVEFIFDEDVPIDESSMSVIVEMVSLYLCKDYFSDEYSGIVIAGFGEKETFPSLYSYIVECKIGNKIKYKYEESNSVEIDHRTEGMVMPFAQDDMVYTILSGVDREYDKFSRTFLLHTFKEYPNELMNIIKEKVSLTSETEAELSELLYETSKEIFGNYIQESNKYLMKHHAQPIFNTIEILPKEELASMAETLVNLTSFKRKISADVETVGGPVDVAIITKGDGFVWIKRKHYFDPQLNRNFFANYYRE